MGIKMKMKIRVRITLMLLILSLAPVAFLMIQNTTALSSEITGEYKEKIDITTEQLVHYANTYLDTKEKEIFSMSIDPSFTQSALNATGKNMTELWDSYEGANYDNDENMKNNKTAIEWDPDNDINPEFSYYLNDYAISNNFSEVFVTDARGFVYACTESVPGDFLQYGEGWWNDCVANGGSFFEFGFDDSTGQYLLDFIQEIRLRNGSFVGMIKAGLNMQELTEHIMESFEDADTVVFIVSENDEIIMHKNQALIGTVASDYLDISDPNTLTVHTNAIENEVNDEHVSLILVQGVSYYSGSHPIIDDDEEVHWGLTLFVLEPESKVQVIVQNQITVSIIIAAIVIGIVIVAAVFLSSSITKPIIKISEHASKMTEKDFSGSLKLKRTDEIGELATGLHTLQETLKSLFKENYKFSNQLAISAEELSSSAEEVSSSSENIASAQQQISKGASNQVVAITETQGKFKELTQGIREIRNKVNNITQISDLIANIANQTNMLALNAAIEAARAGEAGRGFNVVADQVRKLADESKRAVSKTNEMLDEINAITKIQEDNALEIVKAIDGIATVAEETSASTEEAAAAAEEQVSSMEMITSTSQQLLGYAENMTKEIRKIKLDEESERQIFIDSQKSNKRNEKYQEITDSMPSSYLKQSQNGESILLESDLEKITPIYDVDQENSVKNSSYDELTDNNSTPTPTLPKERDSAF
jgi:methyl-accepting chemotaxis protein